MLTSVNGEWRGHLLPIPRTNLLSQPTKMGMPWKLVGSLIPLLLLGRIMVIGKGNLKMVKINIKKRLRHLLLGIEERMGCSHHSERQGGEQKHVQASLMDTSSI